MGVPLEHELEAEPAAPVLKRRRWVYRVLLALLVMLLAMVVYGWTVRDQLARDLIGEQLAELGLPATYTISNISPERQILTDIVVGDPQRPDLTAERVEIALAYGFGIPEIGRITLIKPRLYGSYLDGQISFGSLDPVIFAESDEPAGLPAWDIKLVDGRGLIETDFGPVGLKAEGEGRLDSGFEGIIAAVAPKANLSGCSAEQASLYAKVATDGGNIGLSGPMRMQTLRCGDAGVTVRDVGFDAETSITADFSRGELAGSLLTGAIDGGTARASSLSGPIRLALSEAGIDSTFDLSARRVTATQMSANTLALDGSVRVRDRFGSTDMQADITGDGIEIGKQVPQQLADLEANTDGTLIAPLLGKMRGALLRGMKGASLRSSATVRLSGGALSVAIPQADLRGQSGAMLLSLSRVQYVQKNSQTPRISGNFRFGGRDLPALVGRMEMAANGQSVLRVQMDEYSAGESRMALPEMLVTQSASGTITFAGGVEASGPLPGGMARGLKMPVSGTWSPSGGLAMWRQCTDIAFQTLAFANVELASRKITVCPVRGGAIVQQGAGGLKIAGGLPSLDVSGSLAGTPIKLSSGPVGMAYPGVVTAKAVNVSLGPDGEASRFVVSDILARFGDTITGTFSGADIGLFAVPIDLQQSSGEWDYTSGVLTLADGQFTLADRAEIPRFTPLIARGSFLSLQDNVILAQATLRAPKSDRAISTVAIRHDLSSGTGFADLLVEGLQFDEALQPVELTELVRGVVADVDGVVAGTGRIDWNADAVTSFGKFSSESIDLAAVFGPVKGASGTVEFTDLLSLTTAPDQRIKVASVNPGIEALNGEIGFSLREGQFLGVTGGEWPFMGGTLTLRPVDLNLSVAEERRYVLVVEGLDSGLFIQNMELGNLSATGVFDGELPIVFDELGFGQIIGGALRSRSGGNLSYVGELTYEDLSLFANYAFTTLKSLDYSTMTISISGPLTGDIVTNLELGGVRQGAGTKQNFITRQIADLPIQFNVNIKAPFYSLFGDLKWVYDPAATRDPRTLGLLSKDGTRPAAPAKPPAEAPSPGKNPSQVPATPPEPVRPDEPLIQNSYSEELP